MIDPRKNDPEYVCLLYKNVEFFCQKESLMSHSNYITRICLKHEEDNQNAERASQIKLKLPDATKSDILIMFLDYIDKGKEFPNDIDLYIAQNVVTIAEALKMRQIEKRFLMDIIMPALNKENVIFFIKMAYSKLSSER